MTQRLRLGAYVLAADPTWLRSSLARYYGRLDALVVSAAADGRGWTGAPIRSQDCLALAREADTRSIADVVTGTWHDRADPLRADTAQRQAALDRLADQVDWVLQIDTDEIVPDVDALLRVIAEADRRGLDAVEWPMRVLYRRLPDGRYLQVVADAGAAHVEFPGPIAVRAGTTVTQARRTGGPFLRPFAAGQQAALELRRPPAPGEHRVELLEQHQAIVHNSWARTPADVRRKVAGWGHNQGLRSVRYYYLTWLPAPLRWRRMHDFHPFAAGLWPRLAPCPDDVSALLLPQDR